MLINRADSIAAYDRFLERVIEKKSVWLLVDSEKDLSAACNSQQFFSAYVVPVWSDRAYAARVQSLFPFATTIERIPLETFIEKTVPFLADHGELLGPNWNSDLAGLEVGPLEILEKLKKGLEIDC